MNFLMSSILIYRNTKTLFENYQKNKSDAVKHVSEYILLNCDKYSFADELSWKCPGHTPDMSLGKGRVLKSQGHNLMAGHILCIFSFTCLQRVLAVRHMSSLPPGTKKLVNQLNLSNSPLEVYFNSFVEEIVYQFYFWDCINSIESKIKIEVSIKDFLCGHKKCIAMLPFPPLCPSDL